MSPVLRGGRGGGRGRSAEAKQYGDHRGNHQEPARKCQQLGAAAPAGRIPL